MADIIFYGLGIGLILIFIMSLTIYITALIQKKNIVLHSFCLFICLILVILLLIIGVAISSFLTAINFKF